ncbi:MAG: glycosyltransferase family 2 protein [Cohaesibacter sp.]|nr:glycosyltransferase family 2 protein [Cohaesibacter sp.]
MRISAIIPVKNGAPFIEGALDSLCRQGDLVGEIIVVNNDSSDETEQIVAAYPDARVRQIFSDIPNLPLSRNLGAEQARGDYLYFLDADDRVFDGSLKKFYDIAEQNPAYGVIYGDYCRLDVEGNVIGDRSRLPKGRKPSGDVLEAFLTGNKMIVGAQLVRRSSFEQVGRFNPDLAFAEDWDLWCRMAGQCQFLFVPDLVVLGYTMQPSSMSHYQTIPYEKFEPVLDAIFSHAQQHLERPDDLDLVDLRRQAEGNCQAYICTEAVRMGAHGDAFVAYLKALAHDPARFLKTSAKYVGAYLGL